ncbi:MAG TPA: methionine adenosyltransferase, partial [Wolbachia sp.]|nr:methionine adenosyltransferase [Wolbachia sp.]
MNILRSLKTTESVAAGHPDKVADQISDSILDAYISADPSSRTAIETLVTKNKVIVAGEVCGPNIQ